MGRLGKAKTDEITKLRQEGYTQKETAEKTGVHLRTVRKYDPLRVQKPIESTTERVNGFQETCDNLVAMGVFDESEKGLWVTSFGKRVLVEFDRLTEEAILKFMVDTGRPVSIREVSTYIDLIKDGLFQRALNKARRS